MKTDNAKEITIHAQNASITVNEERDRQHLKCVLLLGAVVSISHFMRQSQSRHAACSFPLNIRPNLTQMHYLRNINAHIAISTYQFCM